MADPSPSRPTSLAFALGQLSERIDGVKSSQERLHADIRALPNTISPRLDKLETRVDAVERKQWLWIGGGTVVLTIVGVLVGHPIR